MPVDIESWVAQIRAGDVRAIARAITAIEDHDSHSEELIKNIFPHPGRAFVLGMTGAPGTGKSTLVDRLAALYRRVGKSVGIVAVDPTSPFTGGAILGDRVRMQAHATDDGIFIRSMATRGFLGGLARATGDVALVLDAAGKQFILVETVGVGQDEVDIVRLADCTIVLLVPGLGDDVQNMKAGLMEIADIFVLNKSDHDGVDRLESELESMLHLAPARDGWTPRIVRTVATENKGVEEVALAIAEFREQSGRKADRRSQKRSNTGSGGCSHWRKKYFSRRAISHRRVLGKAALAAAGSKKSPCRKKGSIRSYCVHELLARADATREGRG